MPILTPDRYYIGREFISIQMCDHLYFIISKCADGHGSHAECNCLQTHILSGVADFHKYVSYPPIAVFPRNAFIDRADKQNGRRFCD